MTHHYSWLSLSLLSFDGQQCLAVPREIDSHSPIGVTTTLVASTPAHADIMRCVGVTSIGTGAAAISSDRHWK